MTENKFNIPSAYDLVCHEYIGDVEREGYIFRHKKTGARVCVMPNSDKNKLFGIAFKTPPEDNTGEAHIIEHTVLCGSRKYPAREPFMKLVKSSLHTFLNAMTYSDKTIYPVSSCNDKDFKNLMDVYLDAVFFPNIYKHREIFMQEGWHYELASPDDELRINGVVYSEMKGKMSSPDTEIFDQLLYALFPDNQYGFNSGGDPDAIPNLDYEKYLDFHRKYYHPSNSYIMLYGDMDMEERLEYMDSEYLSCFNAETIDSVISEQPRFGKGNKQYKSVKYSVGSDDDTKNKTYLSYGSICCSSLDALESRAWDILGEILINSPGAPIKKALTEAGIGQEIYGGFINNMTEPVFSVVAKNTDESKKDEFFTVINETLKNVAENGINKKSLIAEIEHIEFKFREAAYGAYPKGLDCFKSMLQSWLYSDDDPFRHLRALKIYKELKEKTDSGYFESLIKRLIDSDHVAVVSLVPEAGLNEKNEKILADKLRVFKNGLNAGDVERIIEEHKKLEKYQNAPETEEEKNCIPTLSRGDISKKAEEIYNREAVIGNFPAVIHDIPTNGIVYMRLLFDISGIEDEMLVYVDLLSSLLGKMDTVKRSYAELSDEIKLNTGSLTFETAVYRKYRKRNEFVPFFDVTIRVLNEKASYAIDLAEEIITETRFDDISRIKELLAETVSEKSRDILYNGDEYAAGRCLAYFDCASAFDERLCGIDSYKKQSAMLEDFDNSAKRIYDNLERVSKQIFTKENALLSIAAGDTALDIIDVRLKSLYDKLPCGKRINIMRNPLGKLNEGFMCASQVQYVAMGGNLIDSGFEGSGRELVLSSFIQGDILYPNIRMRGGAYGCSCTISPDSGNVILTSYRDPNLEETIDVFANTDELIKNAVPDEDAFEGFIIGTFNRFERPLSVFQKMHRSFASYASGKTYEDIMREREQILNMQKEDVVYYSKMMKEVMTNGYLCALGGEEKLKNSEKRFISLGKI